MDRIPLINPNLVKVIAAQAERTPAPVLRAEVASSEPIKADSKPSNNTNDNKNVAGNSSSKSDGTSKNENSSKSESASKEAQQYRVVLKIGNQQLVTISAENLKKGSQLDVKVAPGPELKIIDSPQNRTALSSNNTIPTIASVSDMSAKAAMQQLLADRIPNIQSQGMSKLIDQLSQLITAGTGGKGESLLAKTIATDSSLALKQTPDNLSAQKQENAKHGANTAGPLLSQSPQTTKQALANLAYQSLSKQSLASPSDAQPSKLSIQSSVPLQQVKDWLQQLPNSSDISSSTGLRNALNNTGVRAETQLSQLAQQFTALSKGSQSSQPTSSSSEAKNANTIFQQLQKIQQKIFSKDPEPLAKTDLASIVKNTAQSLESNSQRILSSLKNSVLNNKTDTALVLADNKPTQATLNSAIANASAPKGAITQTTTSTWQNPLLHSQAYSTLNELMKDPLLQNPSSNNKFALGQMLNNLASQANVQVQIPLNWPERNGSDAIMLRTLQNLLGHIEREQGVQSQQSDNTPSNNPNLATPQNQQWLPLLIHHQQQLQLIEFFINKEEKQNAKGEKKNHWFINLHFDLPLLGELGIEISMFENECNTTFWSESASTLNQISYHVQPLRERLTEQGIIVSDVQSRHGTLAKRKQNIQQRLVDIET